MLHVRIGDTYVRLLGITLVRVRVVGLLSGQSGALGHNLEYRLHWIHDVNTKSLLSKPSTK